MRLRYRGLLAYRGQFREVLLYYKLSKHVKKSLQFKDFAIDNNIVTLNLHLISIFGIAIGWVLLSK